MPANPTPTNDSKLIALFHSLTGGCLALEAVIGIKQNTAAKMQASLDAAMAGRSESAKRKQDRDSARAQLRQADADGEKVIGRCRLRLAALFGNRFNVHWDAAGFTGRTTMVPEVQDLRLVLLSRLAAWFEANPAQESTDMGATAAICQAAHDALSDARYAVNHAGSQLRIAVKEKNRLMRALRKRMRSLIRELDIVLPKNDPRWLRFGLKIPARLTAPRPVKKVTLTMLGNGKVHAQWPAARHATRYRVQMRETGAAEFINAATVHDTSSLLKDLPQGRFIEVRVIAANDADEAMPSPVASVAVL